MKRALLQLIPVPSAGSRTCTHQFARSTRQTPPRAVCETAGGLQADFLGLERQIAAEPGYAVFRSLELAVHIKALVLIWKAQRQSQSKVL